MGAITENVSRQAVSLVYSHAFSGADTDTGNYFDSAGYASGVYFAFLATAFTSGTYTCKILHSDTSDGTYEEVGLDNLVLGRKEAAVADAWPVLYGLTNGVDFTGETDTVSGIVNDGLGTATATTSTPHKLTTGQTVVIAGADQSEYNGTFVVTVKDDNEFYYRISGAPVTATGTITADYVVLGNVIREGVVGQKRYLKIEVVGTGTASIMALAIRNPENIPVYAGGTSSPGADI